MPSRDSCTATGCGADTTPAGACGPTTPSSYSTPTPKRYQGEVEWGQAVYGFAKGGADDGGIDETDSAPFMPKSVVVDTAFDWADDHQPRTPWHDTIIYETHVRGSDVAPPRGARRRTGAPTPASLTRR